MNFIADTPEDVSGWVEGMKITVVQEKNIKFIGFIITIFFLQLRNSFKLVVVDKSWEENSDLNEFETLSEAQPSAA